MSDDYKKLVFLLAQYGMLEKPAAAEAIIAEVITYALKNMHDCPHPAPKMLGSGSIVCPFCREVLGEPKRSMETSSEWKEDPKFGSWKEMDE